MGVSTVDLSNVFRMPVRGAYAGKVYLTTRWMKGIIPLKMPTIVSEMELIALLLIPGTVLNSPAGRFNESHIYMPLMRMRGDPPPHKGHPWGSLISRWRILNSSDIYSPRGFFFFRELFVFSRKKSNHGNLQNKRDKESFLHKYTPRPTPLITARAKGGKRPGAPHGKKRETKINT